MKNLSEFTTEELSALGGQYHTLIGQIESWLYHPDRREFFDYICEDPDYGASDIEGIAGIDRYDITINMEERGCNCCPHASFQRTIPLTYITEDGWKDKMKGLAAEKAAEEKEKRLEKERKKVEAAKRKEERDLSEYKRLQEKFGNKA